MQVERTADRVVVTVDGKPFTAYVFTGHRKPILFPVIGPGGAAMTRSWPLVEGVAGEPQDHPHHESIWFTHGAVNGIDFWASHPRGHAPQHRADNRIEHVELVACVNSVWIRNSNVAGGVGDDAVLAAGRGRRRRAP